MLIITTIYAMDLEPAKTVSAQKPAKDNAGNVPEDSREFLGIYQGHNQADPNEK